MLVREGMTSIFRRLQFLDVKCNAETMGVLALHTISEELSRRFYLIGGTLLVRSFVRIVTITHFSMIEWHRSSEDYKL